MKRMSRRASSKKVKVLPQDEMTRVMSTQELETLPTERPIMARPIMARRTSAKVIDVN